MQGSLVGSAYVQLNASTASFNSSMKMARASFKSIATGASDMERGVKRSTASLGGMAKAAIGMFAAFKGIGAIKDTIAAASNLAETQSKVNTVFGKAAGGLQAWSKSAASALGMSKQQALDGAAGFAVYGKSAGMSGQGLANFSTKLVSAAGDMASFHNASPEETLQAIKSGLAGEAEPLKRFGILMNDATLKAEAMKLGLIKTTKDGLTPGQKVMAANAVITSQLGDAQGDFARTSGGLANQQKILKAEISNMSASIGTALLPYALKAVGALRNFGSAIVAASKTETFKNGLNMAKDALSAIAGAIQPVIAFMKDHKTTSIAVGAAIATFAAALGIATLATSVFTGAQAALAAVMAINPFVLVIAGLIALGVGLTVAYKKSETFRNVVKAAMNGAKTAFTVMKAVAIVALKQMVAPIMALAATVRGMVNVVKAILHGDFRGAWEAAKAAAIDILKALAPGITAIIKTFGPKIKAAASSLATAAKNLGSDIIKGIVAGIKAAAGMVKDAMIDIATGALDAAKSKLGIHSPSRVFKEQVGKPISEGIAAGILARADVPKKAVVKAMVTTVKAATAGLEKLKATFERQSAHLGLANMLTGGDSAAAMATTLAVAKAQYAKLAAYVQANSKKMSKTQKAEAIAQLASIGSTILSTQKAIADASEQAAKDAAQATKDAFTDAMSSISTPAALADAKLAYEVAVNGGEMSAGQKETALSNARWQLAQYQAQLAAAPGDEAQTSVYQAMTTLVNTINDLTKVAETNTTALEAVAAAVTPEPYSMNGAARNLLGQIPHLAKGGMASAGRLHLVGENGPELFVPGRSGRVVNNRSTQAALAGGATHVTVTVDNSGIGPKMTPQQLAQLGDLVGASLSRGGTNARIYTANRKVGG